MRRGNQGRRRRPLFPFWSPLTRAAFFFPAIVLLMFLVIIPVLGTVLLSFVSPTTGSFTGFDNYGELLADRETADLRDAEIPFGTLLNNFIWSAVHLPMSLFTGLFLALILQKVRGSAFVKSFIFLGMVSPGIVGGIILKFLYDERSGVVPNFFGAIGVDALSIQWMAFPGTLLFGLIFGSVWLWAGFSMILFSAGLTTIPKDYFEAAQIDGASPWRTFWRITWPLLRPVTIVVITMTILWELKLFDIVFAAANVRGGVSSAADVLALQMYREAFATTSPNYNRAATIATFLTFLTLVTSVWLFRRMVLGEQRLSKGVLRKIAGPLIRRIRRSLFA